MLTAMRLNLLIGNPSNRVLSTSSQVSYGNLEVMLGNELKPVQVKNMPTKIDYPFTPGKHYTLILTDPEFRNRFHLFYLI